jgi:hypothetical protein
LLRAIVTSSRTSLSGDSRSYCPSEVRTKKDAKTDWQISTVSTRRRSRRSRSFTRTARRIAGSYRSTSSMAALSSPARILRMKSSKDGPCASSGSATRSGYSDLMTGSLSYSIVECSPTFHQGKTIVPAFFRDRLYVFFTNLFGLIASRDRPHEASSDAATRRGFARSFRH